MAKEFEQDALVWAKMKGFPPWPARIDVPSDGKTPKSKKPQHYVFFFGTHDFAWILDEHIFPHSDELLANSKQYKKKSSSMQAAIQEIENEAGQQKSLAKQKENKESASAPPPPSPPPSSLPDSTPVLPKISKKKYSRKKKIQVEKKPAKKRSAPSTSIEDADIEDADIEEEVSVNKVDSDEDYSLLIANVPPNNGYPNVAVIPPYSDGSKPDVRSNVFTPLRVDGESLDSITSNLCSSYPIRNSENDVFQPTTKRIGFLGLGVMGRLLVKKLLCTQHNVTIWNRSKLGVYPELVELGAKTARNPKDVIRECDIIFCCVLDAEASKSLVFGRHGVLDGFNEKSGDKAYVEMSTIDAATSEEIAEAITGKGGRYLEAPMFGSRQDVILSSLVILAAGDKELFTECGGIFAAFSKRALYINCEVGLASKYTACLNLFWGTSCTSLAESLAVIERCSVNPAFFAELISDGPANFKLLLEKGKAMLDNDRTVSIPVKNLKRAMTAAFKVGDTSKQPLNLANAANVVFGFLMQNDQESDISAILKCYK